MSNYNDKMVFNTIIDDETGIEITFACIGMSYFLLNNRVVSGMTNRQTKRPDIVKIFDKRFREGSAFFIRPKSIYQFVTGEELAACKRIFAKLEAKMKADLNFKYVINADGSESITYDSIEETPALIG